MLKVKMVNTRTNTNVDHAYAHAHKRTRVCVHIQPGTAGTSLAAPTSRAPWSTALAQDVCNQGLVQPRTSGGELASARRLKSHLRDLDTSLLCHRLVGVQSGPAAPLLLHGRDRGWQPADHIPTSARGYLCHSPWTLIGVCAESVPSKATTQSEHLLGCSSWQSLWTACNKNGSNRSQLATVPSKVLGLGSQRRMQLMVGQHPLMGSLLWQLE